MAEILKSVKKPSVILGVYYAAVSVAIIAFGSPLFRVLSFEYASLIALFGSLPVMWFAARYTQAHQAEPIIGVLKRIWVAILPAVLTPVVVSLLLIQSCDLLYGLGYYAHIALPSALTATLFGALCGIRTKSKRMRIVLTLSIWIGAFLLSLLPGYLSQQIYTFGWQYGYFPGFVWDEYIELGLRYDYAVLGYMFVAAGAVFLLKSHKKNIPPKSYFIVGVLFVMLAIDGVIDGFAFFGYLSHGEVEDKLHSVLRAGSVTVHHTPDFSWEEQTVLRYDVKQYLEEIKELYPSIDTSQKLDLYLYPTTEDLYRFVGTRRASIAKPWLGALHIVEENLSSLKHELVHLLLKPYGNFPIYTSWSTGLTEGAAVAAEDDYDGLRTADELSAWALAMRYAEGVTPFMQFVGFASTAPATSYILTGSFSKYLLAAYGHEKFLRLYHSRNYENVYAKSLKTLDAEWRHSLDNRIMTSADSVLARYYFDRPAIINQACLRRIGRFMHEAEEAYRSNNYAEAFENYQEAYREDSSRADALRGMILSLIKQRQFAKADAILDTARIISSPNGKALLSSLRGDVAFLADSDRNAMKTFYNDAIAYAANDWRYIAAVGFRLILEDSNFDIRKYLFFRYGLDTLEKNIPQALYERPWESQMPDSIRVGFALLRTLSNEVRGEYSAAIHEWTSLPIYIVIGSLSPNVRKAYDIIDKRIRGWMRALDME